MIDSVNVVAEAAQPLCGAKKQGSNAAVHRGGFVASLNGCSWFLAEAAIAAPANRFAQPHLYKQVS